jgi:HD-GYP domain-containing protein (c-di-GMP phosphodiesterase class II)
MSHESIQARPGGTNDRIHSDIRHAIYALSDALDLVGIEDVAHGKRVGIMAAQCAQSAGFAEQEITFLFDLGMLHDIGVSSTSDYQHHVDEFEWENSRIHCETGHRLLRGFRPLAAMAEPILFHHRRWNDPDWDRVSPLVREQANLIYLVDRVDALSKRFHANRSLLQNSHAIRDRIERGAGTYFAPHLVEFFLAASAREAFWLNLEPRSIQFYLNEKLSRLNLVETSLEDFKQLARIFACIVDGKSRYTMEHSQGVASLSRWLAVKLDLSPDLCDKIEVAGLLHDLGKLRIPDSILDKPGPLSEDERRIVNSHSFETYQILRQIAGFEDIACWAAYHHEEPSGNGYPFHVRGAELSVEARIIAVADVFQAMIQDRPYRAGFTAEQLAPFLRDMAAADKLDAGIVELTLSDISGAMAAALPISACQMEEASM